MLRSHARLLFAAGIVLTLSTSDSSQFLVSASKAATTVPTPQTNPHPNKTLSLVSHRAVYELTLAKSVGTKSPTAAHGRIAFDFTGSACDGYVQNFRQLTELQPAEGPTRVSDMHSATFEDADGRSFDFKVQTSIDSATAEAVDGKAWKSGSGRLLVNLSKPKRSKVELDAGVVFPTEHLKRILAAAIAGENLLEVKVYDGSETGTKIYETTTYIGRPIADPAVEKAAHIPELDNIRRWPVSISYFDGGKKDDGPSYILSFDLYENGISRALKLDYGDFVLAGEMSSLELLSEPACTK
ncbi:cell envelope integrity EipB family protein [Methylocapsa sp. D3K7]|uniref:cell envelope integrity EipB family protein n=1 Tax=Methylocapsa sp. D3K7 TaxID=3041435 RepID=UPI00244EF50E|nr:cell envelope integrity EipB family protein [Methylocapsa sp. D3K7]WGJ15049.1 cell envelope integrity EipB family protein [Methylocapsa sp. D3K7]